MLQIILLKIQMVDNLIIKQEHILIHQDTLKDHLLKKETTQKLDILDFNFFLNNQTL